MYPILIAQDHKQQHLLLLKELDNLGIKNRTCKDTEIDINVQLIRYEPSILICNASKLGIEAVRRLCSNSHHRAYPHFIINTYTYEDPQELEELRNLGVTESLSFPYDAQALAEYISSMLQTGPCNLKDLIKRVSDKLDAYLIGLNRSEKQRGNLYIRDAVLILLFEDHFKINLHGDIYLRIAKKYSTSVKSVEHSIRISIENCWKNGSKDKLCSLMGNGYDGGKRPSNSDFIMALSKAVLRDNRESFGLYMMNIMNNTSLELHI